MKYSELTWNRYNNDRTYVLREKSALSPVEHFVNVTNVWWQRLKWPLKGHFHFVIYSCCRASENFENDRPGVTNAPGRKLRDAISKLSGAIIPWRNPAVIEEDNVYETLRSQRGSRYAYILCEAGYRESSSNIYLSIYWVSNVPLRDSTRPKREAEAEDEGKGESRRWRRMEKAIEIELWLAA